MERHERLLQDYLSATLMQVTTLSKQLDQLKANVFKIEQQAKQWAEKPLIERRKGDSKPLDTIAARLKLAERKTNMFEEAKVLHRVVLEESQMLQVGAPPRMPRPPQRRQSLSRRSSVAQRRSSLVASASKSASAKRGSIVSKRRSIIMKQGQSIQESSNGENNDFEEPGADSYETPVSKSDPTRGNSLRVYSTDQTAGLRSSVARNLVESPGMMNSVHQKRIAWDSYIQYLDQIQFRGIRNAVINTMKHLLTEIGVEYAEGAGAADSNGSSEVVHELSASSSGFSGLSDQKLNILHPLIQVQLRLSRDAPKTPDGCQANFVPDLDEKNPQVFSVKGGSRAKSHLQFRGSSSTSSSQNSGYDDRTKSGEVSAMAAAFGDLPLMSQLMTVIDDIKSVADVVNHLSDDSKSFRVKLEHDPEVSRLTSLFLSVAKSVIESCQQFRNNVFLLTVFFGQRIVKHFSEIFYEKPQNLRQKTRL